MSPIAPVLERLSAEIAALTAALGNRVDVAALGVTDRAGQIPLRPPGRVSPNGACRLVRAADGWIAVNLAREEDRDLAPAWLRGEIGEEPWGQIERLARRRERSDLIADAVLLGLPAAAVGEVACERARAEVRPIGVARARPRARAIKVVDLSALWAGPLCGAILASMGAAVTNIESVRRPDPTRTATPEFFRRLNGAKSDLSLDLGAPEGLARLWRETASADVLITSARPRGLETLGLTPEALFAVNPGLVWVAVTGYGWRGAAGDRVAFGDDAAAAGGLVRWTADGDPRFLGDALADPVTGLAAAIGALEALATGRGAMVEAALAPCAAGAAAVCGLRQAA